MVIFWQIAVFFHYFVSPPAAEEPTSVDAFLTYDLHKVQQDE